MGRWRRQTVASGLVSAAALCFAGLCVRRLKKLKGLLCVSAPLSVGAFTTAKSAGFMYGVVGS